MHNIDIKGAEGLYQYYKRAVGRVSGNREVEFYGP